MFDLEEFIAGFHSGYGQEKSAETLFETAHTSFFPMLNQQAAWKYVRTSDSLKLHDGHNTFHFDFPSVIADEEVPVERRSDSHHHEFEAGAVSKGTAQVHRSDPGSVYLTLQDGKDNPTFTLSHQSNTTWKIVPKKKVKKIVATLKKEANGDAISQGVIGAGNMLRDSVIGMGQHPLGHAASVLAGAYGFNKLREMQGDKGPQEVQYEQQHPVASTARKYGVPLGGALLASALAANIFSK